MTSTTATPSTTFQAPRISNRRRWIAISAGALALAGATVAVVAFDGSETDRPAVESVVPASAAAEGLVSADAAERHAITAASKCTGLPADAAERCMIAGR